MTTTEAEETDTTSEEIVESTSADTAVVNLETAASEATVADQPAWLKKTDSLEKLKAEAVEAPKIEEKTRPTVEEVDFDDDFLNLNKWSFPSV